MHDDLSAQLTASAVAVWALQKLKKCPRLPFIHETSDGVNTAISAGFAALAAAGIHYSFDSDQGVLTITGLTIVNVLHLLGEWFRGFVFNEVLYRGTAK